MFGRIVGRIFVVIFLGVKEIQRAARSAIKKLQQTSRLQEVFSLEEISTKNGPPKKINKIIVKIIK